MYKKPDWTVQGADWPHRDNSRFVIAGGLKWHVQIMGSGPVLLLLHGTGAATHSWARLIPLLAKHYTIVAPDLPGHGFTATPSGSGLSLPGMSVLINALIAKLNIVPFAIVGHSAGAAIGAQMILGGKCGARHLISINGAFKPFDGLAAHIFPVVAKMIALNPITILALASGGSDKARVKRLLEGTGSCIDDGSLDLYARLFATPGHVNGVMGMMARWELNTLSQHLPDLTADLTLIVGSGDLTISPSVSKEVLELVPTATLVELGGLGHLAHEEAPVAVAHAIEAALNRLKLI